MIQQALTIPAAHASRFTPSLSCGTNSRARSKKGVLMRRAVALGGAMWMVIAAGCVKAPSEAVSARAPHSGPIRIGFSMDTLKEERWQRDKALVTERAKER